MDRIITLINYTNDFATATGAVLEALVLFWFCSPLPFREAGEILSAPLLSVFSTSSGQDSCFLQSKIGKIVRCKGTDHPNGVSTTSADPKIISLAVHLLTIAALVLLHCQHYRFLLQCPLLTVIILAYICLVHQAGLKNGLVLSVVFCIVSEISHMFCDDIIRNWLAAVLLDLRDGTRDNYFNILLYTLCLVGLLRLLKSILFQNDRSRLRWREIMVPFLSVVPFFYMRNYQYEIVPAEGSVDREIYLAMILMAILSLVLIIFNEHSLNERIDCSEMEKMELLLKQQKEYYRQQDETMRAVNRNYHDLKHVLTLLKATVSLDGETSLDSAKNQLPRCDQFAKSPLSYCDRPTTQNDDGQTPRHLSPDPEGSASDNAHPLSSDSQNIQAHVGEYVERLKKEIAPYENLQRTGNETLDILLSQKLQECSRKEIRAIACADGRKLSFVNPLDLCVLIGNAFDNAIEAAQQVEDEARREISVRIGARSGQIFLRFENFYQGETPDLKTSKADKTMHGYGIRNMEMTAEKYGGIVTCEAAEGSFILTIMIPVPVTQSDTRAAHSRT